MSGAQRSEQRRLNTGKGRPGGVTGKGFKPGQSGNPGGKVKIASLEAAARAHTPEAIEALVLALRSPRERVPAAIALLDRGWGKPAQMITGDTNRPLIVDFRWADNTNVDTAPKPVIDAVSDQLAVTWSEDASE